MVKLNSGCLDGEDRLAGRGEEHREEHRDEEAEGQPLALDKAPEGGGPAPPVGARRRRAGGHHRRGFGRAAMRASSETSCALICAKIICGRFAGDFFAGSSLEVESGV